MKCLVCDSPLCAGRCENPACALFLALQPRLVQAILDRLLSDPTVPISRYRWIERKLLAMVEKGGCR